MNHSFFQSDIYSIIHSFKKSNSQSIGITTTRLRTFRLLHFVYRHFVYRYFVYYDFLAEIEAGVMKRILYQWINARNSS